MSRRTEISVLIADHSTVGRQTLEQMLEHLGVTGVIAVRGAGEARDHLARRPADVLIADFDLPDMDILKLLGQLRDIEATREVKVILTSARHRPDELRGARDLGLVAVLPKPFQIDMVLHCIEMACGRI